MKQLYGMIILFSLMASPVSAFYHDFTPLPAHTISPGRPHVYVYTGLNDAQMVRVLRYAETNPDSHILQFEDCTIGPRALQALGFFLSQNIGHIEALTFIATPFAPSQMLPFLEKLRDNHTLTGLILEEGSLPAEAVPEVIQFLKHNQHLRRMRLGPAPLTLSLLFELQSALLQAHQSLDLVLISNTGLPALIISNFTKMMKRLRPRMVVHLGG